MHSRGVVLIVLMVSLAAALVLGSTSDAWAQIGEGWNQYVPNVCLHHAANGTLYSICPAPGFYDDGVAHYDNDGQVETFTLYLHTSNRVEIRVQNNYTTGLRQFQGWVWIEAPTNNESVMQIFGGQTSATGAMFRAFNANGGEIRHYSSQTIASGIYGTWTQLNAIHDADNGLVSAYINGQFAGQWSDHGPATHYFKYGCYGTHDDQTPCYVWWTGVSYFFQ